MAPPPLGVMRLIGQTSAGVESETTIEIESMSGRVQRTAGLIGDTLRVIVAASDLWPEDWDLTKSMRVEYGDEGETVSRGGYFLQRPRFMTPGTPLGGGTAVLQQAELSFTTVLGRMHEGRGGLLSAGTLNILGKDGLVRTDDPSFRTLEELIQICAGVITGPSSAWDLSLSIVGGSALADIWPGGPYDFANVRALSELTDLLAQVGWTGSLSGDGETLTIYRLPQPGEDITLPTVITDNALPYRLSTAPSNRSKYVVVTSGRTRTTVLTRRDIDDLEWVYFDSRTNSWLNQAQHEALYPTEIGPADITALQAGPGTDPERNTQLGRVFTALRLVDQPDEGETPGRKDLRNAGRFAVINGEYDFAGQRMSGTPAFVVAKFCVETADGQFVNQPMDGEDEGLRVEVSVLAGEGIVQLPARKGEPVMARVTPGADSESAGYARLRALTSGELTLYFAHEADTGDMDIDYARAVYRADEVAGEITAVLLTAPADAVERAAALDDPSTVVIEQPGIRRVVHWEPGDSVFTELNEIELTTIMQRYAQIRIGSELVVSGEIEVKGLRDIDPGDAGGAISAVVHDLISRNTIVYINQHEVPQSVFSELEYLSGRALASGLERFRLPGSSAARIDVRQGSSPGDALPANASVGTAELDPAQGAATRGADAAAGTRRAVKSFAPRREARFGLNRIYAVCTSSNLISGSTNRWRYDWEEIEYTTAGSYAKSGRTSATMGFAYNRAEMGSTESGLQPDGVNRDNLIGTFARQPIGEGQVVELSGPIFDINGTAYWTFFATNHYDGACEEAEP